MTTLAVADPVDDELELELTEVKMFKTDSIGAHLFKIGEDA